MLICKNCGVELDDGLKLCPLCGRDPEDNGEQEKISVNYPSGILKLQKAENRKYYWELSGIIAFSGITVCTIIDLLISKELKWSLLSDVSIAAAWVILTLYQFAHKKPLVIISSLLLTVLASLFLIDLIAAGRQWFFPVGLPVTLTLFAAAGIVTLLYKAVYLKGLNIIAAAFMVLSGFCIILEMILDKYMDGAINFHWSLIVSVSVLPVSFVLFFYYYRLKKGNRLESFFHV